MSDNSKNNTRENSHKKGLFGRIDSLVDSDSNYEINQYVLNVNYPLPKDFFDNIMTLEQIKQKRRFFMHNFIFMFFCLAVSIILFIYGISTDKHLALSANPTSFGLWIFGLILLVLTIVYAIIIICFSENPIEKSYKSLSEKIFYLQYNHVIKPIDNSYPELVFMLLFANGAMSINLWKECYQKFPVITTYGINVGLVVFFSKLKVFLDNKSKLIESKQK